MSAAKFWRYFPVATRQMPDRSGFPPTVGAGADKFGLPSGFRGVFGTATAIHWPSKTTAIVKAAVIFPPDAWRPARFRRRFPSLHYPETVRSESLRSRGVYRLSDRRS